MQPETLIAKKDLLRLSNLADNINEAYSEAHALAEDAKNGARAAVKAVIRAGGYMNQVKDIVGHGNWENWRDKNCQNVSAVTAQRWMAVAKASRVKDLSDVNGLTDAYRKIGILPDKPEKPTGTGTADVDAVSRFFQRFERGFLPVAGMVKTIDPQGLPADRRKLLLEQAQPMVEFIERVKALEVA